MTCDPHANLHLGLSAEAMVLIDPQLADRPATGGARQPVLLSAIFSAALLMLLPGAPIHLESGLHHLARSMEYTSRGNQPPVAAAPSPTLSR